MELWNLYQSMIGVRTVITMTIADKARSYNEGNYRFRRAEDIS